MNDEQEHTQTFTGYFAEVIRLQAERAGKTPQAYILSFFESRCNAPHAKQVVFKSNETTAPIFHPSGALHLR